MTASLLTLTPQAESVIRRTPETGLMTADDYLQQAQLRLLEDAQAIRAQHRQYVQRGGAMTLSTYASNRAIWQTKTARRDTHRAEVDIEEVDIAGAGVGDPLDELLAREEQAERQARIEGMLQNIPAKGLALAHCLSQGDDVTTAARRVGISRQMAHRYLAVMRVRGGGGK